VAAEGRRKILTEAEELASKLLYSTDELYRYKIAPQFIAIYCIVTIMILLLSTGYHSEWGAKIGKIRIRVRKMCKKQWWFWLVVTLVFLNTCTVAVEHYGQPDWLTNFLGK
jgi:hypothetical protein